MMCDALITINNGHNVRCGAQAHHMGPHMQTLSAIDGNSYSVHWDQTLTCDATIYIAGIKRHPNDGWRVEMKLAFDTEHRCTREDGHSDAHVFMVGKYGVSWWDLSENTVFPS